MFIELIDNLRCVEDHRYIALVASIWKREERQVIEGILGCPACRREYPIHDGIAWFGTARGGIDMMLREPPSDPDAAMRIGAFLNVSEGMTVALTGDWAARAPELAQLVSLRAFAVNPLCTIVESERVGTLYSDNRLPFRDGSLRGVAIGESGWSSSDVETAAIVLAPGGRMVAPADLQTPPEIDEIARDDAWWIGEKRGALVALHRG